jgi:hypothetical protein
MQPTNSPDERHAARVARRTGVLAFGLTVVVYASLILLNLSSSRARFDAERYHIPVVNQFADQWPTPDVSDYLSATTPGYHWLLAGVGQLTRSTTAYELVGAATAALVVACLVWWLTRRTGHRHAAVVALPLAVSPYFVHSAVSVLPDNAAWLGVLAVLLLSLTAASRRGPALLIYWLGMSLTVAALILVRQSHAWAAGVTLAAGWLASYGALHTSLLPHRGTLPARAQSLGISLAAIAPAVLILMWFVSVWGGLAPPTFAGADQSQPNVQKQLSLVAPAYILMLFAVYAPFFAALTLPNLMLAPRRAIGPVVLGAGLGLGLALIGPSNFDQDAGRYSGYWRVVAMTPTIAGRTSTAILFAAPLGGAMVGALLAVLDPRSRWLMLTALAGFAAAQIVNANAWQRYYEPFVLIWLALHAGIAASHSPTTTPRLRLARLIGPAALTAGLAGLTAISLAE